MNCIRKPPRTNKPREGENAHKGITTKAHNSAMIIERRLKRRSMIIALLCALVVIPLWAFSPSLGLLVLGGFLMQFMVQGAWGIIPAHLSELAPDSVRGFLPGFAYQCGVLMA